MGTASDKLTTWEEIRTASWPPLVHGLLLVYLLLFMEWLFFVTKPSFMSALPWLSKLSLLFVAVAPFLLLALMLFSVVFTFHLVALQLGLKNLGRAALLLPSVMVGMVLLLLLVDNFTYTVTGWGIVSTTGIWPSIYLSGFVLAFVVFYHRFSRAWYSKDQPLQSWYSWLLCTFMTVSAALIFSAFGGSDLTDKHDAAAYKKKPNIVFFASDGINAEHLSGYGYPRETTPNLDKMMSESLVFEAAYPNASRTTGSTVSMLNSKYPTTTKVLFPPHTLSGAHSLQHLPAILRANGYQLFQETMRYYADAADLNMQMSFHVANRRVVEDLQSWLSEGELIRLSGAIQLAEKIRERVVGRFKHLLSVESMQDVYREVDPDSVAKVYGYSDRSRVDEALRFMGEAESPFFVHIHLMDSHCCSFRPKVRHFSSSHDKRNKSNAHDFYLDTLLQADQYFEEMIQLLRDTGKLENTLIVYSSDHGKEWKVTERLPLLMRFPNGLPKGRVADTVQMLDVAPTILDYLEIDVPPWMEGQSLLTADVDRMRPVFAVAGVKRSRLKTRTDRISQLVGSGPPLYGLQAMSMVICHRWYNLGVETGEVEDGYLTDHPAPCLDAVLPDRVSAGRMIAEHLRQRGILGE